MLAPVEEVSIWLRLYNLAIEYWNEESFQALGSKLGFYIKADEAIESKDFNMYAQICIGWKPNNPLPEQIEIITNAGQWLQKIEVEESNEKCNHCKKDGHMEETCSIGPKGKNVETTIEDEVNFFVSKANTTDEKRTNDDTTQPPPKPFFQGEGLMDINNRTHEVEEIGTDASLINKHREVVGWVEEAIIRVEKAVEILDEAKSRATPLVEIGLNSEIVKHTENDQDSGLDKDEMKENR
ncbi:uncharacterized protein LOC131079170 [Cryptomeria japonica]|uniref:uncharacterized protein LOC131079170 n=1 Tax=Cryptomeria japonica TaxID=3369 RepID=UPI0027DA6818|nr:uncharacterized protein LOC131079170 [Cryptomeria japonica]